MTVVVEVPKYQNLNTVRQELIALAREDELERLFLSERRKIVGWTSKIEVDGKDARCELLH